MTETIAPPTARSRSTTGSAARRSGTSGRSGPVWNPATGEQSGAVDFATVEEVDAAVQPRRRRSTPGARSRSRGAPSSSSGSASSSTSTARTSRASSRSSTARCLRRARRGRPRARGDRVRLRDPDPAQGRVLRAGLDRDRRLLDPAAARRRRRDHAVQLPRDGAHVDVGAGDRLREHLRPQAVREGSVGVDLHGRAAEGGRPARRRLQRRPRRQGCGRRDPRAPGHRRGQLRRLDADRALHLRDRDEATASACRRSAARRTT